MLCEISGKRRLYRWGSTGPLRLAAAGSSPPPPRSDVRCCKALLGDRQKTELSFKNMWREIYIKTVPCECALPVIGVLCWWFQKSTVVSNYFVS